MSGKEKRIGEKGGFVGEAKEFVGEVWRVFLLNLC
jgi:hypothetical protein